MNKLKKEHGDLEVKRLVTNYEVEKLYKMNSDDFRFLFRIEDEVKRYDENLPTISIYKFSHLIKGLDNETL